MGIEDLLEEKERTKIEHKKVQDSIQKDWEEEITADFKKAYPRQKKINFDLAPNYKAIRERWVTVAGDTYAAQKKEKDKLEELLKIRSEYSEIPKSEEWNKYEWVYRGAYSSQGWGELKYSTNAAQMYIDKAEFYGIEGKMEIKDYEIVVYVKTTKEGVEILKRKPEISLKEQIKLCWKRGVNPRVYNPFLPYGIEEKLGLDYFGNETK